MLTTVDGGIDTTYSGVVGAITYYVPKTTTVSDISNTDIQGSITFNGGGLLYAKKCPLLQSITVPNATTIWVSTAITSVLTRIIAPKAKVVLAAGCALTDKSIGEILYAAYLDNRKDVNFDFSGGTNANDSDIDTYLQATYSLSLSTATSALEGLGGTLFLNGE